MLIYKQGEEGLEVEDGFPFMEICLGQFFFH